MKKILAYVLAAVMMIAPVFGVTNTVFAADPTLEVATVQAQNGDTVDVAVKLVNNPGIASINIDVSFPKDLTLKSITYNNAGLGGMSQQPQTMNSPVTLNWFNGAADTNGDMLFATLNFTVSEEATAGDKVIDITYDPDNLYNIAEESIAFAITKGNVQVTLKPVAAQGVSLNKESVSLKEGEYETLSATVTPEKATNKNVSWKSSDTSVATVDAAGKITAVKKGTATITVTTADGGFTDTCAVTVACAHRNTTATQAEPSTCQKQGNEAYTTCDDCKEVISGSNAKLPLAGCNFVEKVDTQYLKSAATCVSKAVYYKSCSVCGRADAATFESGEKNANNHTGGTEIRDKETETCAKPGYSGDTWCLGCNTKITTGTVINATGQHVDADGQWEKNDTQHFHICGCGAEFDHENHKGGEATCIEKAICSACNTVYGEKNSNKHTGGTEVRDAKNATCKETGYTGDIYCLGCQEKIASGREIEFAPHQYEDVITAPTCVDKGYTTHTCKVCQKEVVDTYTDAIGHIVETWAVKEEATIEKEGSKEGTCKVCEKKLTASIGKLTEKIEESDNDGNVTSSVESVEDTVLHEDVVLERTDITHTLDAKTKAELKKKIGENLEFITIWDIALVLRDIATDGSIIQETEYEPNGKVKVTMEIPKNLLEKFENIQLIHFLDDGTVEVLDYVLNGTTVTFETDKFSYYAFAGTKIPDQKPNTGSSPQTGDSSNMFSWMMIMAAAVCAVAGTVVVRKKRK